MSKAKDRIASFVDRAASESLDRVSLTRQAEPGRMVTVSSAHFEAGGEEPSAIADRFLETAIAFVDEAPDAPHRFLLVGWSDGKAVEQIPLTMNEGAGDEGAALAVAAPAAAPVDTRVDRHTLRHLDRRDASMRKQEEALSRSMRAEMLRKGRRIEHLEGQLDEAIKTRLDLVSAVEQAKSLAHERQLAQAAADATAQTRVALLMGVQQLLPIVVSHLTGSTMAAKFVESLDEAKLVEFIEGLGDDQRTAMAALIQTSKRGTAAGLRLAGGTSTTEEEATA